MKAKTKLALVAVSVLLLASLAANGFLLFFSADRGLQNQVAHFQSQVNDLGIQVGNLENQSSDLRNQISLLQNENSTLQSEKANLENQAINLTSQLAVVQQQLNSSQTIISSLQTENVNLQNQLELKKAPSLVTSLGITDINSPGMIMPHPENTRLYIAGGVYNFGATTAYNCRLHVIAYRGDQTVIDTYITLGTGTMNGGSSVNVNENIHYSGGPLSYWKIIPECTSSP